ncbi:RNA recognition motif domain-containing protein [Candidatus Photodesmus blepharus]|uniref:RNA recognition motif domain-containing protein n=1 Tax=Candidatus Photodesmus blepharonis TaxID=1179155 RepID=UPI00054E9796|nr:RNA-binding protein [Candidatus Photodesmus blepharus]
MNFNKSNLLILILALSGGILFSQITVSPALSFFIGVCLSALVLKFSNHSIQHSIEPPLTKTLYVGNLPYKVNETDVRELFSQYSKVLAVRLMKDKRTGKRRGFGFVVINSSDVNKTIQALNGEDYLQRTLKVRVANDPKYFESNEVEQE